MDNEEREVASYLQSDNAASTFNTPSVRGSMEGWTPKGKKMSKWTPKGHTTEEGVCHAPPCSRHTLVAVQ